MTEPSDDNGIEAPVTVLQAAANVDAVPVPSDPAATTSLDLTDAAAIRADAAGMTDDEFAAAAAADDARVMTAMDVGVVVHTDLAEFVRAIEAARQEKARRDADPRTADQMRAELGELLQRFYDARWYGTREDVRRTGSEVGLALRRMQHRITIPAEAVAPGDYIRAVGRNEGVRLIQLPAPLDRGRPAWLEHPGPSLSAGPDVGGHGTRARRRTISAQRPRRPTAGPDRPGHPPPIPGRAPTACGAGPRPAPMTQPRTPPKETTMADDARPPDSPRPDPTNTPAGTTAWTRGLSFRDRWAQVISTTQTPRRWAEIAAAIRTADGARVDAFGDPLVRGSEDWCRVAVTAMEAPAAAARATAFPDRLPDRCLCNTELLRAWLNAPAAYADPFVVTVADLVADRDWSQAADETTQDGLQRLLAAAQDAGLFGVYRYRIELHGVAGEDGWISRHLLVARPTFGPGLASELLDGVVPTIAMSGVDSAVAVLSAVAREVDVVLDGFDALAQRAASARSRRAFPPPAGLTDATATPDPAPSPDAPNRRGIPRGR